MIEKLNPIIKGWGNYYSHVVFKKVFCRYDHILINQLKR
ncbi:MAG: group II intron maturase-specific domain-containing protein [Parabacteroides merdae]